MGRLSETFAAAEAAGRAALIGYFPSGFPNQEAAPHIIAAMVENGVDIVEVGLPYSDPLMDGATIQAAVHQALLGGSTVAKVLQTVTEVAATGAPTLVMSYWNPIERIGVERFATQLAAAGGVGVITPDLTPEESASWVSATDAHDLDRVFLVAPSSSEERIAKVAAVSSGFVYAASTMGVTGTRASLPATARELVARTRPLTCLPVCVGVGVSNADQAHEVAGFADGVIVGSAFVARVLAATSPAQAVAQVGQLAAELAAGVRR